MMQGVLRWNGHDWMPKRGLHSDITCSECGVREALMYERDEKTYCEGHRPDGA